MQPHVKNAIQCSTHLLEAAKQKSKAPVRLGIESNLISPAHIRLQQFTGNLCALFRMRRALRRSVEDLPSASDVMHSFN